MSTEEAAIRLGCTKQHVRFLIRQGKIEAERFGRDWMVSHASIEDLGNHKAEQSAEPKRLNVKAAQVETLFDEIEFQPTVNVASVPQRSPFRYPGGKTWLIPWARMWLSGLGYTPDELIEPFAGGGGIGLTAAFERLAKKSHLVELDSEIAAVWRVMVGGAGPQLASMIRKFPFSPESVQRVLQMTPLNELELAFHTILKNRVSRGGILAPGAGFVKTGEAGRGMASRWYPETISRRIENIDRERNRLIFTEGDGLKILEERAFDPRAAFFIDPPYPFAGKRLYKCYSLDHEKLFDIMDSLTSPFLATYEHSSFVEDLAIKHSFETRLVPMKSSHHERKFELLISRSFSWLNKPTPELERASA